LRIDRRIDIWKILFKTSWNVMATTSSQYIARWLMEAVALLDLGMPQRAFKLTFTGDMNPSLASQIFKVALKDAAWQDALEKCTWATQYGHLEPATVRTCQAFIMAGFPQAMRDIASGTSIAKCNFPIGRLPGKNEVPPTHVHWSLTEWKEQWNARRKKINNQWPSSMAVLDLTFVPNTLSSQTPNYPIITDVPGYSNDHIPVEIPVTPLGVGGIEDDAEDMQETE